MKGILPSPVHVRTTPSALIDLAKKKRIGHKPGWLYEGDGNPARSNRGLPMCMPHSGADVLLPGIVGRKLHQMLHARSPRGQLRTRADEQEGVGSRERSLERRRICKVSDHDIDPVT